MCLYFAQFLLSAFFPFFHIFSLRFVFPVNLKRGVGVFCQWTVVNLEVSQRPPKTKQKTKWDRADDQIAQFDFMCARHDAPQPSASHDPILETPKKSRKVSAGLRPSTCFHG
jgi:hypothetical protein